METTLTFNGLTYRATTTANVTTLRRETQRGRTVRVDLLDVVAVDGRVVSYSIRRDW